MQRRSTFHVKYIHSGVIVQHCIDQVLVASVTGNQQGRPTDGCLLIHRLLHVRRTHELQHHAQHIIVANIGAVMKRGIVGL